MGYMRHNAIIVTSWNDKLIGEAIAKAKEIGLIVLGPANSVVNSYQTILIAPDGSKEGWTESNTGDRQREQFRDWLNAQRYEDGSTALEWVEVAYGSDDHESAIEADAWENETEEDEP